MGIFSEVVREGLTEGVTLEQGGERSDYLGEESAKAWGCSVLSGQRAEWRPRGWGGARGTGRGRRATGRTQLLPAPRWSRRKAVSRAGAGRPGSGGCERPAGRGWMGHVGPVEAGATGRFWALWTGREGGRLWSGFAHGCILPEPGTRSVLSQPLASPNVLHDHDSVSCLPAKSVARRGQEPCSGCYSWVPVTGFCPVWVLGGWRGHTSFSADSGHAKPSGRFLGVRVERLLLSCFPN